jgi:hypothetical protein
MLQDLMGIEGDKARLAKLHFILIHLCRSDRQMTHVIIPINYFNPETGGRKFYTGAVFPPGENYTDFESRMKFYPGPVFGGGVYLRWSMLQHRKCRQPASTTKASCNDASTGSLHANKLTFVIESAQHAINGQYPYIISLYIIVWDEIIQESETASPVN